jgi:uncharacterized membrane protein YjjP (DUF1212 family)
MIKYSEDTKNSTHEVIVLSEKVKEIYKENFAEYLLCLALDVGEGMLKNGGEVARVEDTIERICYAYGAAHVEVFSIISYIDAAIRMEDGSYSSQLRRVKQTGTDLSTLERLNALSRDICIHKPPLEEFDDKLHKLRQTKVYPKWITLPASAVATSAFALFFGGSLKDALVAGVIGLIMAVADTYSGDKINQMAKILISAFIAAILSAVAVRIGLGANEGVIMIGAIMLLVPGLAFGTALRDLLCGDLLAGMLKTLQAILASLMIAFGYLLAGAILGGVMI